MPLDFAGALAASFPDFWLVPPAFVTVVGYFGLQNVGEVYGSRRTYGCVLRLAM